MSSVESRRDTLLPLVLTGVEYVVGARRIIDRVSLTLESSLRTIIVGANGAGKSILLRLCHGLIRPTAGTIRWSSPQRGGLGRQAMVFQRPVMLRRSALANIEYALALAGVGRAERAAQARTALRAVGLEAIAARPARVLSGGEQQRLALARAWALAPEVLFLDEPTANLDPGAVHEIERVIDAMHANGTKIAMVTHNLGQAKRMGDEIVFMHRGRVLEHSPVNEFFRAPRSPEAARFLEGELPW